MAPPTNPGQWQTTSRGSRPVPNWLLTVGINLISTALRVFRPFILLPILSWFLPHVFGPYKITYGFVDRKMTSENQGFNLDSIDSGYFQGSIVTIPILCEAHSLPNDCVSRSLSQSCQFARWHRLVSNITLNGLVMPAVLPWRQCLPSQTHEYPGNKQTIQV